MISMLAGVTRRAVNGVCGAFVMARQKTEAYVVSGEQDGTQNRAAFIVRPGVLTRLKDALVAFRLLYSPHTEGLTVAQAVEIIRKAHPHRLDPFDLWMVFDACDDLDHAVTKALEMKAFYAAKAKRS